MAGGRPRKYDAEAVERLKILFAEYIDTTEIPIICEFAYQNDILRDIIYDYPELTTLRKKAIAKKEAQLERLALKDVIDKTMAIFSLKQLGWSDRSAMDVTLRDYKVIPADEEAIDADD